MKLPFMLMVYGMKKTPFEGKNIRRVYLGWDGDRNSAVQYCAALNAKDQITALKIKAGELKRRIYSKRQKFFLENFCFS